MTILPKHHQSSRSEQPRTTSPMLPGDSKLIIVAGSDSIATTLTHLFHLLAADPTLVRRLRQQVGPMRDQGGNGSNAKLVDASFLNDLIEETLRVPAHLPSVKSEAKEQAWHNVGNESAGQSAAEIEYIELVRSLKTRYGYDWSVTPEDLVA